MLQLSIIIPTWREARNLQLLIPRLQDRLRESAISAEIIVVDDNSQDGTEEICGNFPDSVPVRLIVRRSERGLSSAVIAGMDTARGDVLLCMDADLSHPPESVPALYAALTGTDEITPEAPPADFVIGSRYVPGGSTEDGWGLFRWLNSRVATWLALALTSVNDPMAGFFALRRSDFTRCRTSLDPVGYKIGLELLVKSGAKRIRELPIAFANRLHGESKLTLEEQWNYLRHLTRLYRFRFPGLTRMIGFGLVGTTGVAVDLLSFAGARAAGIPVATATGLAIWLAMTSNFLLNRGAVFPDRRAHSAPVQYGLFCLSCLAGACVNWTVRVTLLSLLEQAGADSSGRTVLAALTGILAGTGFNFLLASRYAFQASASSLACGAVWTVDPGSRTQSGSASVDACLDRAETEAGLAARPEPPREEPAIRPALKTQPVIKRLPGAALVIAALIAGSVNLAGLINRPAAAERPVDAPAETLEAHGVDDPDSTGAESVDSALSLPATARPDLKSRTSPGRQLACMDNARPSVGGSASRGDAAPRTAGVSPEAGVSYQPLELELTDSAVEQRLQKDAAHLASDDLEGRGVRTAGLELAAKHIAEQFDSAGLNTRHYGGTPYQEFELYSLGSEGTYEEAWLRLGSRTSTLDAGADFSTLLFARTKQAELPVVFAGFGITAGEIAYDDYHDLDVTGAAVVILRQMPPAFSDSGRDLSSHSWIRTKIANAVKRGAAAVLFCSDSAALSRQVNVEGRDVPEQLLQAELIAEPGEHPVPVLHVRRSTLEPVLREMTGFDLTAAEQKLNSTLKPQGSRLTGLTLQTVVSTQRRGRTMKNVLGTLDGDGSHGPETIIVGAHYDHLGRGGWGSLSLGANHEIHNGADDNASGTAVLLEVGRQLAAREKPLPRRVLLIAFSAEELGLIGSRRYVREPLVPLEHTLAMLNLDMVGRLRNDRLTVYGTGTSPDWPGLLVPAARTQKLELQARSGGFGPSDHASFYEKGIPVLHFFTGFHPQYHRPGDDSELLNIEGMRRIAGLVTDLVVHMAESTEPLHKSRSVQELAGDRSITIEELLQGSRSTDSTRPLLGIVPGSRPGDAGITVERTLRNSAADRFGIRSGDVIQSIDGESVKSVEDLVRLVQAHAKSDSLTIRLSRNGIQLEVQLRL